MERMATRRKTDTKRDTNKQKYGERPVNCYQTQKDMLLVI